MNLSNTFQRLYSFWWERSLGINTTGHVAPTVKWGVHYTPLPYKVIGRVLIELHPTPNDVFVDIGCGKGRVVCCAARLPLAQVIGIEVNEALVAQARSNVESLRGRRSPVAIIPICAEKFDYSTSTLLYLYNPFDKPIMQLVFAALTDSYRKSPRPIRIAYVNCLHEDVLQECGWIKKLQHWPAEEFPAFGCPISFWGSPEATS